MHWYRDKVFLWLMKKNIGKQCILILRRKVLTNVKGKILEIGIGEGVNLPLYPNRIHKVTAVDNYLRKINNLSIDVEIVCASADNLPFDNN